MFITCGVCEAQNLVVNSSFEDTVSCPIGPNEVYKCANWVGSRASPDYMNACSSSSMSVPVNWGGYQQAADGNAYCGIATYYGQSPNYREHIRGNLITPLLPGTKYFVSFKIALSIYWVAGGNCASNKMGVMFTTVPYDNFSNQSPITNNPPVYTDSIVTDTVNWTRVTGSFIADSAYSYILIGNFFDDNLTDTIKLSTGFFDVAYYYFDDVRVSTDSAFTVETEEIIALNSFNIYPNPFIDKINITTKTNELLEVSLYDISSRKLFYQSFLNSTSINTEQLAKGIYLYEVRNKNGVIKKGKVVKD